MGREPNVEVELVEVTAARTDASTPVAPGAPGAGSPGGVRAGRAPARLRPRTVVATGLAVVLGLAGTQAVLDARERAVYARYADVRGVVAPLAADLEVLWRPSAGDMGVLWGEDVDARGRNVGVRVDEAGAPEAVALDAGTGEAVWSVRVGEPEELLTGTEMVPWVPCDLGTDQLLVCLVHSGYVPGTPVEHLDEDVVAAGDPSPAPTRSELVVLDARDGTVVRREAEELGTGMLVLDDVVVTARVTAERGLQVRGRHVRTGDEVWTWASPPGAVPPPDDDGGGDGDAWLTPVGDDVLVAAGPTGVRLTADGTLRATYDPGPDEGADSSVTVVRGHVVRHAASGALDLLADDGTRTPLQGGFPGGFVVDDGSEPDLVVTQRGSSTGIDAWDTRTGTVRWSRTGLGYADAVVLEGVLYIATSSNGATALDLDDGRVLWSSEPAADAERVAGLHTTSLLTDGRVLAVVGQRTSGPAAVQAFELTDGSSAWTAELPAGVMGVHVISHRLVSWGFDVDDGAVLG